MNKYILQNETLQMIVRDAIRLDTNIQKERQQYLEGLIKINKVCHLQNLDKFDYIFKSRNFSSYKQYFKKHYNYYNNIPGYSIQVYLLSNFNDILKFYNCQYGLLWLEFEGNDIYLFTLSSIKQVKTNKFTSFSQMRDNGLIKGDYTKDVLIFLEEKIKQEKKLLQLHLNQKQLDQSYQKQNQIQNLQETFETLLLIFKQEQHCFITLLEQKISFLKSFSKENKIEIQNVQFDPNFINKDYHKDPIIMFQKLCHVQDIFLQLERLLKKDYLVKNKVVLVDDPIFL